MSSIMAGKMGEGTEEQKDRACFIFQIDGYCKFGEDCRRAHRAGDDWTRVFCGDFLKTGDCRYGAEKCFRSHDLTRLNAQREQHRRHQRENQGPSLRSDVKVSGEGGENGGGEGEGEGEGGEPAKHVEKPNFAVSGALAKTENLVNGVVVKYAEPPDGRAPDKRWRLYVFKGDEELEPLRIHRLSSYMIGRERKVADVLVHHPSISKQHAVLQFRSRPTGKYDLNSGVPITKIKPYIIDLESTNGTMLNGKKIEPLKYYELLEEDCIKFGFSSRSYVLMEAAIDYGGVDLSKKNRSKLRKGFGDDDDDTSDDGEDYTK